MHGITPTDTQLYLLHICFSNTVGYSLWTTDQDRDLLLCLEDTLILFSTEERLREFADSDTASNLLLAHHIPPALQRIDSVYASYDFAAIEHALRAGQWSTWSMKLCTAILNGLNLLWDMANSINEQRTVELFTAGTTLHQFIDVLTFIDEGHRSELDAIDNQSVIDAYTTCLGRIEEMTLLFC